ncbi:MAG: hypothetical protein JRJ47_14385 [Deltaproteobacteria bacterium]|nr:hypothetical protein [Deltaproteobacteria bacterium]
MGGYDQIRKEAREWRRWDDELVEQFAREVRFLAKVLGVLLLAGCTLVIMKIF